MEYQPKEKKNISTRTLLAEAVTTLKATAGTTLLIVILGMIGPQVILGLMFDALSAVVVSQVRNRLDEEGLERSGFMELLQPAIDFGLPLFAYMAGIVLVILVCYFALVHVAVHYHRGKERLSAARALWLGLKTTIPSGIVAFVCMFVLLGVLAFFFKTFQIEQLFVLVSVLIVVTNVVIPVILVAEGRGGLRALRDACTLRYARGSQSSGWAVMFVLLTLGAVFYTGMALIGMASQMVLVMDQLIGVSRDAWMTTFFGLPIGPAYLAVSIFEVSMSMLLIACFPAVTAALYFKVVARRELGSA